MERIYTEGDVEAIAKDLLSLISADEDKATVIAFQGDLGVGKTTLTKEIARQLGVSETVHSPTFVVLKRYTALSPSFKTLIHMDAYRIEGLAELQPLRFDAFLQEPNTLIIVEWPENIQEALPKETHWFHITHEDKSGKNRMIKKHEEK